MNHFLGFSQKQDPNSLEKAFSDLINLVFLPSGVPIYLKKGKEKT